MKVLFISANTEQVNMPVMPLGLACVAEAARGAGHTVALLDLMFGGDTRGALQDAIGSFQPECIGISVRNIDDQKREAPQFLLEKVKGVVADCRHWSTAPIVVGGAGFSIFPESVLGYLEADMGIAGEGETALPAVLARLAEGRDPSDLPGVYLPGRTPQRARVRCHHLDRLALPGSDMLSASAARSHDPWIPVQTRRGCALRCSYCSTPLIEGTILRKRSPERVVDWIAQWAAAGFTHFFFVDNTFNLPNRYAMEICRRIIARRLEMAWRCILYPGSVTGELVACMAAAGCTAVSLGFESGSAPVLRSLGKRFTPEEIRIASDLCAAHGIEQMGFLMLGGPGETRQTVEESLAFADSLRLDALQLTVGIRIYPGTALAETARREGMIPAGDPLLRPRFYLARELEGWLPYRLRQWARSRPYVMM